jgi:hypothetical protein
MQRSLHVSVEPAGVQESGGLKNLIALRAEGTVYLHDSGGHRAAWSVVARFGEVGEARFEFSRLKEKYALTQTADSDLWDRTPPLEQAQSLERGIRWLNEGRFAKVMEHLSDPDLKLVAADDPNGRITPRFRAEGKSQNYLITLDAANRPSEIVIEGLEGGSAHRIMYSDYVRLEDRFYPKTTQVILPGDVQGVEARFDTVQIDISQGPYKPLRSKR